MTLDRLAQRLPVGTWVIPRKAKSREGRVVGHKRRWRRDWVLVAWQDWPAITTRERPDSLLVLDK